MTMLMPGTDEDACCWLTVAWVTLTVGCWGCGGWGRTWDFAAGTSNAAFLEGGVVMSSKSESSKPASSSCQADAAARAAVPLAEELCCLLVWGGGFLDCWGTRGRLGAGGPWLMRFAELTRYARSPVGLCCCCWRMRANSAN